MTTTGDAASPDRIVPLCDDIYYRIFEAFQANSDGANNNDCLELMTVNRAFANAGRHFFTKTSDQFILDDSDDLFVIIGYNRNCTANYILTSKTVEGFLSKLRFMHNMGIALREVDVSNLGCLCKDSRVAEALAMFNIEHLTMHPKCECESFVCPFMKPSLKSVEYMSGPSFQSFKYISLQEVSIYIRSIRIAMNICKNKMSDENRSIADIDVQRELLSNIGSAETLVLLDVNTHQLPFHFMDELISNMKTKCLKLIPDVCPSNLGFDFSFATEAMCLHRGFLALWPVAENKIKLEQLVFSSAKRFLEPLYCLEAIRNLSNWFDCSDSILIEYSGVELYEDFRENIKALCLAFQDDIGCPRAKIIVNVSQALQTPEKTNVLSVIDDLPVFARYQFLSNGYNRVQVKTGNQDRTVEVIVAGYDKEVTLMVTIFDSFNDSM